MNLLIHQNKLIFRGVNKLQNLNIFLGFVIFLFTEKTIIENQIFFIPSMAFFSSLYFIQDGYRRGKNTIDISNLVIYPSSKTILFKKYLLVDLTEWKSILIIFHLFLLAIYSNFFCSFLFFLCTLIFSLYISLHNFLVRRYNWAYQTLLRIIGGFFSLSFFPIMWLSFIKKMKLNILKQNVMFENHINDHIFFHITGALFVLIIFYFIVKKIILSKIQTDLYANQKLINKHGSLFV